MRCRWHTTTRSPAARGQGPRVTEVLRRLRALGSKAGVASLARFGLPSDRSFGVSVTQLKGLVKELGRDHRLALDLWQSGWRDARMLACLIDDPATVTPAQMDRWCRAFDNWGICDNACFSLFDRTPYAWRKVTEWSRREAEFEKRAAFALLWGLTVHDKAAPDRKFLTGLALIERAAVDERRYVKLAVDMALRAVGKRNRALNRAATVVARRLAGSASAAPAWIGRHALKELRSPSVLRRIAEKTPGIGG